MVRAISVSVCRGCVAGVGVWRGVSGSREGGRLADRRHNISSASSNNNINESNNKNSSNTSVQGCQT